MVKKNVPENKGNKIINKKVQHKKKVNDKNKSTSHKSVKKKSNKNSDVVKNSILAILVLVAILAIFVGFRGRQKDIIVDDDIAAVVNGHQITMQELNQEYNYLPDYYQEFISKQDYLETVMIPQKMLSIKAVVINDEQVNALYSSYLDESELSEEEILVFLKEQGLTIEKFKEVIRIQIYLNETLYDQVIITEEEVLEFYDLQKEMLLDDEGDIIPFDLLKGDIEDFLYNQKLQEASQEYVEDIKYEMDVEIFYKGDNVNTNIANTSFDGVDLTGRVVSDIKTFTDTEDDLCKEDGKPLVILFSTTTCPYCKWIKDTFDSTVLEYGDQIAAYHWELNNGNNVLSDVTEKEVPKRFLDLFRKYNSRGAVPSYVFGCKYIRIGNGHNDLQDEQAEFRAVIEELIA
jgi:thioredoxin-related protein